MLVVMENGNFHSLPQRALDIEALRRLDILQVDAAEGRLQTRDNVYELVRIALIDLDIEHVNASKFLEQAPLAFHHRLAGECADVAEPEHGRAIGDDRNEIGARCKARRLLRVVLDGETGIGNTRRIGEREVALNDEALGRRDRNLSGCRNAVILQCVEAQLLFHIFLPSARIVAQRRYFYFFFAGGRSVQTPSNTSAAMPIDSDKVGCGWMVLPISTGSHPISTARHTSPIRSPACVPTMPPPSSRWLLSSKSSLVKPSSRPFAIARPDAAQGKTAFPYLIPCALHCSSVRPAQATSGSV